MTLRYLLTAAALALASLLHAADPVKVADDKPPPLIKLPPEPVANVAKYDALKVRDVPWDLALVKVPEAHAKNPLARGKGVKVAVVDTWAQPDHPGLHGMVKGSYSAITHRENPPRPAKPHFHGTWCVGAVHAVVPDADLYVIEGLDSTGSGSVADLAHGIDYAVSVLKADVVSCSFGGPSPDEYLPAAIRRAVAAGVVVVCAAGNDGGGPGRDTEGYPGRYPEAVSVAACDKDRQLAAFSSWGPNVFTVDPGVDVTGLLPDGQEGESSGTSMSTPKEAGKVASWIASNAAPKDKDRADHYRAAVKKASPFTERTNARGYGLYTLDRITGEPTTPPPPPPPPPGGKEYVIDLAKLKADGYTSVRIDLGGAASSGQPIPVTSLPAAALGPTWPHSAAPPAVVAPVPTWTGFAPAPVWSPPPPVYQPMPATPGGLRFGVTGPFGGSVQLVGPCPGGVCRPGVR